MAEKQTVSVGNGKSTAQSVQSGPTPPSAGALGIVQGGVSLTLLDSSSDKVVQPFPRSPKLQKKTAKAKPSKEQFSKRLEELQVEKSKTEAHIQSLKKRSTDLSRSTEKMKQQVREYFENMQAVLKLDEQAVLDSLELDLRRTRTRLDQVVKTWKQHRDQVNKRISSTQEALSKSSAAEEDEKGQSDTLSSKKQDDFEKGIRLNEERFERLLKTLSSISRNLRAQLQRKTLLLDSSPVVIDRQTCHSHITVTSEGRGMCFSGTSHSTAEHPLQFDKVCCALGFSPITTGQNYWEVDVRCCAAWSIGVAYSSLQRKGKDKGAKLGRNRSSWCVELRNHSLSAWHNNRHVACQGVRQAPLRKVGVWVDYNRGQLIFYDADAMVVLQRFSAAMTPVFDRAHHQFTEPLYPAIRFLKPHNQTWPNHLELCHLNTL